MFALRFFFVTVLAVSFSTVALAAEKTTAVWSDGRRSVLSDEELTRYAITSPGPGYPEEAQKVNATGSGHYELRISKAGTTTAVIIIKGSGNAVLDKAATRTLKKWRFKPGVFTSIRVPVNWSVNRVR